MVTPALLTLRTAQKEDRRSLSNLLHFESHVHTHLDWRRPLDWLGHEPYLVAERAGRVVAALAAPPDPPGIAWLRLFAAGNRTNLEEAWQLLWPTALKQISNSAKVAVAIPMQDWFQELLIKSDFKHTHNVIVMDWYPGYQPKLIMDPAHISAVRKMTAHDLKAIFTVDNASFAPQWQHSLETIHYAFAQSAIATVIEVDNELVAYQISTASPQGIHLARLAVHPAMQRKELALSLLRHLQLEVSGMKDQRLSVNTQDVNLPSIRLYEKTGFTLTEENLPVFELSLNQELSSIKEK